MLFKCLLGLLCLAFIGARLQDTTACPRPDIQNGFIIVTQRSQRLFFCSNQYQIVGNRYANCRNGEWDVPFPVCVKPGCPELPRPANATQNKMHRGAWLETFCLPGFQRNGSLAIYCNGYKWNATSPTCVASAAKASLSCDFENPDICGWTPDELHDFDWRRFNYRTPSHLLKTGPAYDHTLGQGNAGYYMYIESSGREENDTARLLSPIFDAHLATSGCFSFFYHMYGRFTGGLRIYQKPDSLQLSEMLNMTNSTKVQYILFEQWGNLGDFWYSAAPALKDFTESFQIVIEGIRGRSISSDIAIDDIAILQGIICTYFRNVATSPPSPETIIASSTTQKTSSGYVSSTTEWVTTINQATTETSRLTIPRIVTPDTDMTTTHPTTVKKLSTTERSGSRSFSSIPGWITMINQTITRNSTLTTPATPGIVIPTKTVNTIERPTTTEPSTTTKLETTEKITNDKSTEITKATTVTIDLNIISKPTIDKTDDVGIDTVKAAFSPWKVAVITIVVLSVFVGLSYLGVTLRTARGKLDIARLRGRDLTTHDAVIHYHNSIDDQATDCKLINE